MIAEILKKCPKDKDLFEDGIISLSSIFECDAINDKHIEKITDLFQSFINNILDSKIKASQLCEMFQTLPFKDLTFSPKFETLVRTFLLKLMEFRMENDEMRMVEQLVETYLRKVNSQNIRVALKLDRSTMVSLLKQGL